MQRLTFPFPFVHHQSHVYQQPRPSGTTINRRNEDTWPVTADNKEIAGRLTGALRDWKVHDCLRQQFSCFTFLSSAVENNQATFKSLYALKGQWDVFFYSWKLMIEAYSFFFYPFGLDHRLPVRKRDVSCVLLTAERRMTADKRRERMCRAVFLPCLFIARPSLRLSIFSPWRA